MKVRTRVAPAPSFPLESLLTEVLMTAKANGHKLSNICLLPFSIQPTVCFFFFFNHTSNLILSLFSWHD